MQQNSSSVVQALDLLEAQAPTKQIVDVLAASMAQSPSGREGVIHVFVWADHLGRQIVTSNDSAHVAATLSHPTIHLDNPDGTEPFSVNQLTNHHVREMAVRLGLEYVSTVAIHDSKAYGETELGTMISWSAQADNVAFRGEEFVLAKHLFRLALIEEHRAFDPRKSTRIDTLTGLSNRTALRETIESVRNDAAYPFSAILIDLQQFANINEVHGHENGDIVLHEVGVRLTKRFAGTHSVNRLGSDEFVITHIHATIDGTRDWSIDELEKQIREILEDEPVTLGDRKVHLKVALGAAVAHSDSELESLLELANVALTTNKRRLRVMQPAFVL
jgi:diguanylate cyclase (GGDEF)-like protein